MSDNINTTVITIETPPGITTKDDNPLLSAQNFTDGNWTRFSGLTGLPEKMLGLRSIGGDLWDAPTDIYIQPQDEYQLCLYSQPAEQNITNQTKIKFEQIRFTINGEILYNEDGSYKKTFNMPVDAPIYWKTAKPSISVVTKWEEEKQSTLSFYIISFSTYNSLASAQEYNVYGALVLNEANEINLVKLEPYKEPNQLKEVKSSGGLIVLNGELIVIFGQNGVMRWNSLAPSIESVTLDVFKDWPLKNSQIISSSKLICARTVRSAGLFALLLWSFDSLYLCSYTATIVNDETIASFQSSTIATQISIISEPSIVQANNIYYWIGNRQFYMYTGTVALLDNCINREYFFRDLDFTKRNLIVGQLNDNNREIWWYYTSIGSNIINNKAIVYSLLYNTFYITNVPLGVSSSYAPSNFFHPIITTERKFINSNITLQPRIYFTEIGLNLVVKKNPVKGEPESILYEIPLNTIIKSQWLDLTGSTESTVFITKIEPNFVLNDTASAKYKLIVFTKKFASDLETRIEFDLDKDAPNNYISVAIQTRYFAIGLEATGKDSFYHGWNPKIYIKQRDGRMIGSPQR